MHKEIAKIFGAEFGFVFKFLDKVVKHLNLEKDSKILDIGTGQGRMAITLALNNYKVITGEPESDNSEYAKQAWLEDAKKVKVDHLINFKPFNAEQIPFKDKSLDAIFIMGALHHIDDKAATIKECIRTIKTNSVICIFEPTSKGIKIIRKGFPTHPDAVDPRDYTQNFELSVEIKKNFMFNIYIFKKLN